MNIDKDALEAILLDMRENPEHKKMASALLDLIGEEKFPILERLYKDNKPLVLLLLKRKPVPANLMCAESNQVEYLHLVEKLLKLIHPEAP